VEFLPSCRKLPDDFALLVRDALSGSQQPERFFLEAYVRDDAPLGQQLRDASSWLHELAMVDDHKRGHERVAELLDDARAVEAAQAVVAAVGTRAARYLSVLATDGSESSVDVLLPLVTSAAAVRDERLDVLTQWLVPFVRGPLLAPVLAELESATTAREDRSPLQSLLTTLGVDGPHLEARINVQSREVKAGFLRRANVWLTLNTEQLPHVRLSVSRYGRDLNPTLFVVADGVVTHDALKLKPPANLEVLPRWIRDTGRKLGVHWEPPDLGRSSLRGLARKRLVDWISGQ
jgi:hypothetical protein